MVMNLMQRMRPAGGLCRAGAQARMALPVPVRLRQHISSRHSRPSDWRSCEPHCRRLQQHARLSTWVRARSDDEIKRVADVVLPVPSAQDLEHDRKWLTAQVRTWLDEEWTPLDVHQQLGEAAAEAYVQARIAGEHEMGGILLSVSSQLLAFNFFDTFVDAFQVGNKVSEVLMLRIGCDVCCANKDDKERYIRVDQEMSQLLNKGQA